MLLFCNWSGYSSIWKGANDGVLPSLVDVLIGLQNRFQLTFELNAALRQGVRLKHFAYQGTP